MNLRLDRLATLYLVSPYLRLMEDRKPSVPILMYHSIADEKQSKLHPYYRTTTSPAVFALQLKHLRAEGYTTCTLARAISHLRRETPTARRLVAITFDDGYRDFYCHAFPLLNQYGFNATMFLPTAYIGKSPTPFKGADCLTWAEVTELKRYGVDFGSHTVTHPQLRGLDFTAINNEVVKSKETIEQKLGCSVDSFAYPYAFPQTDTEFKKMLGDSLQGAGYQNGVCTVVGRANRRSQRFFLERLPVNSCDDASLFQAKLSGAYDWIGISQYISKVARTYLSGSAGRAKLHVSNAFHGRSQVD
jgi:peptidoglycan/xylan/chitin deacetylase (PgdA/CDA1 family)